MKFPSSGTNALTVEAFDTMQHLAHATQQARARGLDKITIVDADTHHEEGGSTRHMLKYIDSPVERFLTRAVSGEGRRPSVPLNISYQDTAGRLQRFAARKLEQTPANLHRDITLTPRSRDAMGATFGVLHPTTALRLSTQPKRDWEFTLALAYNRWLANDLMPQESQLKGMMYLPMHHATESLAMIEELGDKPGIANWEEPALNAIPQWGAVQAVGIPHSNMTHMTNWLISGMPERLPKLKVLWLESGIAWVNYLGQRLRNTSKTTGSEAPLLKERPSRYMKRMYYCSQPLEMPEDQQALEVSFRAINAETQMVWGSNFPSHEFDVPATIWDLPFLSESAKKAILGGNAMTLFGFKAGSV